MSKKAMLLTVLWLAAGCEAHQSGGGTMAAVSRETATAMATKGLRDLGRDPGRYDLTVDETDTEWQMWFEGKQPRPPGDDVTFYVNKQTGAIRHMLGE